jgi:hypothetical protein
MNDNERITQLEMEVAALVARDRRRESEHLSVLTSYTELAASRETLRHETDETLRLQTQYFDQRLAELSSIASGADPGTMLQTLAAAAELLKRHADVAKAHNSAIHQLFDRLEAIERLVAPVLAGKAKLLAQEV